MTGTKYSRALLEAKEQAANLARRKAATCYVVRTKTSPRSRTFRFGHCFNLHKLLDDARPGVTFKNEDGTLSEIIATAQIDEKGILQTSI